MEKTLPPPAGYSSWLDYAVERFDTREVWLDSLFETSVNESTLPLNRDEIRDAARMELRALRAAAGSKRP